MRYLLKTIWFLIQVLAFVSLGFILEIIFEYKFL